MFALNLKSLSLMVNILEAMKVRDKNVLFDPMAHTPEGYVGTRINYNSTNIRFRKSGPGDHGRKGIEDFIKRHVCTTKCVQLGLDELATVDS